MNTRFFAKLSKNLFGRQRQLSNDQKRFLSGGEKLRFDEQTAIVTGGARGIGREYALLLASRGANVVVNDFGGDRSGKALAGSESSRSPAQQVVDEILARWPESRAIANEESISSESGAASLVKSAVENFGRVDILVNNAGILRDKSFAKMSIDDWDQVHNVHLRGSFLMSRECWPHMRQQNYGRIIMTSSTSGLFGNFGQANYSAAKMGLVGLSNTLAIEGAKSGIHCNTIVPLAASRLTEDILPEDLNKRLSPAYIAPIVVWLCHKDCNESGVVVEAAGKWYGCYRLQRTGGAYLRDICQPKDENSVEMVAENWAKISTFDEKSARLESFQEHLGKLLQVFEGEGGK